MGALLNDNSINKMILSMDVNHEGLQVTRAR